MGKAERTTKLLLELGDPQEGAANMGKREYLAATTRILNEARAFYLEFFLAHPHKLFERVQLIDKQTGEVREAPISADKLLTWAESQTVSTRDHPDPDWNFSIRFPGLPWEYRRSVIKDCIGKARAYSTAHADWKQSGKKRGQPGKPTPTNHPTLYAGVFSLQLDQVDLKESFVGLRVFTGTQWVWANYPVQENRYFEARMNEPEWNRLSPSLVLKKKQVEIHFPQEKIIVAKRIVCSRCGARGERFSRSGTTCTVWRGGTLFHCLVCGYEAQADFNASVNVHHSFWREWHWRSRKKPPPKKSSG